MNELKQFKNSRMCQNEYTRIRNELENNTVPASPRQALKNRVAHLDKLGLSTVDNNK